MQIGVIVVIAFYRQHSQSTERQSHLPKITQVLMYQVRSQIQALRYPAFLLLLSGGKNHFLGKNFMLFLSVPGNTSLGAGSNKDQGVERIGKNTYARTSLAYGCCYILRH